MKTISLASVVLLSAALHSPARADEAAAIQALTKARDSLAALLDARTKADAAKGAGVDVVLELAEPFVIYHGFQLRPPQAVGLPWRTELANAADRYAVSKMEFAPVREDARLTLQRRGGQWFGPQLAMLSAKARQQFHLRGADAGQFKADTDGGVTGDLRLTTVRGDFRFDMHLSGEACDNFLPEFGLGDFHLGFGDGFFPDWWAGPRERMQPFVQGFQLQATQRRGWLLRATLGLPVLLPQMRLRDAEVFLWVDEGRLLRGWVGHRDKPFQGVEYTLTLQKWELQGKTLAVELSVRTGDKSRRYVLRGELAQPDGGAFAGTYQLTKEQDQSEGVLGGVLYRAFAGTYTTAGVDGNWSQEVLAGVAPATVETAAVPAITETGLRQGLALYRQVAALDRALREYPLPLPVALQEANDGTDNRNDYWALRYKGRNVVRQPTITVPEHLHEALAAEAGPAAYLEELAKLAQQAVKDRQAGQATVVGTAANPHPEFGPFAAGKSDWQLVGNWTCFGVVPRTYSFDSAPYLPEVAVVPALKTASDARRMAFTNEMEHLWVWHAEPNPTDGRVRMSRTLLTPTREERARWGTNYQNKNALFKGGPLTAHTGTTGDTMDFFYQLLATWYATTTIQAEKAERIWLAAAIGWDGRLWVNGSLVWRPDRRETPNQVAVFPVDLVAGENRLTVCCSARPIQDGNMGNMGARIHKYAERMYGEFALWTGRGQPASGAAVPAVTTPTPTAAPAAAPPIAWDLEKKINVRWQTALPTRDAEPAVVGAKLFLTTTEGGLACLDAHTGKEVWRKTPAVELPAAPKEILTVTYDRDLQWKKGTGAMPYKSQFAESCLPAVADAQRVWMHNHRGAVACYQHDGTEVWAQQVPAQVLRVASGQELRARVVPPVGPASLGSLLIVAAGDGLIALDKETGKEKWRRPGLDFLGRFATMNVGGGLVLLCSGEVLDAATGQTLFQRAAPEMNDSACVPVVDGAVAYYHAGSAAVRFWAGADGGVRSRLLWDSPADARKRGSDINSALHVPSFAPTPALWRGLLINHMAEMMSIEHGPQNSMRLHVSDAATGCAVAQRYCVVPNAMHPARATVVAGDYVFCADRGGKTFGNNPKFPETPQIAVLLAGEQPRRLATNPGLNTLAPPVAAGRRLYLAGDGQVVCIERPEALGDKFSEHELAALAKEYFPLEIGAKAEGVEAITLAPLAQLPAGVPVVPLLVGDRTIPWDKSTAPLHVGFPCQLNGAWPLPDQPVEPQLPALGATIAGVAVRAVPAEGIATGKKILERTMLNYFQGVDTFALNTTNLFTGTRPARGLFGAVLDNRRTWTLRAELPADTRLWLASREVKTGDYVRLAPGYYSFVYECRVTAETAAPLGVSLREYPCVQDWAKAHYSPATEPARRRERIRENETFLRQIAGSGGKYAEEALAELKP